MDLFTAPDFDYSALRQRLAEAASHGVYLGTSSWKYPGWFGTVYDEQRYLTRGKVSIKQFEKNCLVEYAQLFPTVCVDAAYYRFPAVDDLLALGKQVPQEFKFTLKVTDEITIKRYPSIPKHGSKAGCVNPYFLDIDLFNNLFLRPCQTIADKVGMLIFEFSPFDAYEMKDSGRLLASLSRFLGALPSGWDFGVEIRNESLLTPDYFAMLDAHNVTHIFNSWAEMPSITDQLAMEGSITRPACIGARLLLKPGRKYQQAVEAFSPYNETKEVQPDVRKSAAALVRQRRLSPPSSRTYLYFNNRLEGNAPRTIAAVLEMAADGSG